MATRHKHKRSKMNRLYFCGNPSNGFGFGLGILKPDDCDYKYYLVMFFLFWTIGLRLVRRKNERHNENTDS